MEIFCVILHTTVVILSQIVEHAMEKSFDITNDEHNTPNLKKYGTLISEHCGLKSTFCV
jgi:hypothetical protein